MQFDDDIAGRSMMREPVLEYRKLGGPERAFVMRSVESVVERKGIDLLLNLLTRKALFEIDHSVTASVVTGDSGASAT